MSRVGPATPATFAMIRFSKVRQFEIDRERFRHLMRVSDIQTTDNLRGTFNQPTHLFRVMPWLRVQLSMLNQ